MAGITDAQRDLAVSMARDGHGRNEIARVVGISAGSVTNVTRAAGVAFDPKQVETAVRTRKAELAERRAQLELDLIKDADRLRRLVWARTTYYDLGSFGEADRKYSEHVERVQDTPTPADQLKLIQAATIAVQNSQKIADASQDNGAEQARSMLTGLFDSLGSAFRTLQAQEDTPSTT